MSKLKEKCICKVSSTINKDVKNFGKQFMFDNNDETCWNSDEGDSQWILIKYDNVLSISGVQIQFQGGFAAEQCVLETLDDTGSVQFTECLLFDNNNLLQTKTICENIQSNIFKLSFNKCYDTYGRIIVYHLKFV